MKLPQTKIQAVAFDMDGLMFNTEELYERVGDTLLRRRGHRISRALLNKMMGRPGSVALQVMIDTHGLDATVEQLQQETAEVFPAILEAELAPMEGLLELLDELERRAIPKAVCTSSGRQFARQAMSKFELERRFDFILTGEDVNNGKPAPDIYQAAAAHWGVPAKALMVLEDSEIGCQAAVAAGAYAVAVPGPHNVDQQYPGAHYVADSLSDRQIYAALAAGS